MQATAKAGTADFQRWPQLACACNIHRDTWLCHRRTLFDDLFNLLTYCCCSANCFRPLMLTASFCYRQHACYPLSPSRTRSKSFNLGITHPLKDTAQSQHKRLSARALTIV